MKLGADEVSTAGGSGWVIVDESQDPLLMRDGLVRRSNQSNKKAAEEH
jgi:hypothetical protein